MKVFPLSVENLVVVLYTSLGFIAILLLQSIFLQPSSSLVDNPPSVSAERGLGLLPTKNVVAGPVLLVEAPAALTSTVMVTPPATATNFLPPEVAVAEEILTDTLGVGGVTDPDDPAKTATISPQTVKGLIVDWNGIVEQKQRVYVVRHGEKGSNNPAAWRKERAAKDSTSGSDLDNCGWERAAFLLRGQEECLCINVRYVPFWPGLYVIKFLDELFFHVGRGGGREKTTHRGQPRRRQKIWFFLKHIR